MADSQRDDKGPLQWVGSRELAEWAIESAKLPGTWEAKAAAFLAARSASASSMPSGAAYEQALRDSIGSILSEYSANLIVKRAADISNATDGGVAHG